MTTLDINTENKKYIHPYKVILYLAMGSILMFFAITTSALLVKKGDVVSWEYFKLPTIFYISTVIFIVSSVLMHWAKNAYKALAFNKSLALLVSSIAFAILFLIAQLKGFDALNAIGKPLTGNASGSFIWVIVLSHGAHIIGGLVFALIILIRFIRSRKRQLNSTKEIIFEPKRFLSLELLSIYWHFIDFIWIYLFIFFYFNY